MAMSIGGPLAGGWSGGGAEPLAVGGRADAEAPVEGAAQDLGAREAGGARGGLDARAVLEQRPGALDAQPLDVRRRGHPDLGTERAGEVPLAERGAAGQRWDGEVRVEVAGDPRLELAQRLARGGLRREARAELRLAAGALEEEHEPAGRPRGGGAGRGRPRPPRG